MFPTLDYRRPWLSNEQTRWHLLRAIELAHLSRANGILSDHLVDGPAASC
jgi:hypothetical protein